MDKLEQYFYDTMDKIGEINEVDEFAKMMLGIIKNGNVELYLKRFNETKIFDDAWINTFEGYFINIDNIIRNPRKALMDEEELVPVERARNLSVKTVQHLARNTQYIKDVNEDGTVVPSKVLSVTREDFYGIYENRFIKTLINRIYSFIRRRYDVIKENYESYSRDHLEVISGFNTESEQVNFKLDIDIRRQLEDSKINQVNYELLQRVERLYSTVKGFKTSSFMNMMEKFKEVNPPIMKTNIIMKNVDFKSAHALWLFLDHYTALGLETTSDERNLSIERNYQSDIFGLIIMAFVTAQVNERKRKEKYTDIDYDKRLIRRPKLRTVENDPALENGDYWIDTNPLNEYILNDTKINFIEEYKKLLDSGKSEAQASDIILKKILSVTNELYKNFFSLSDDPDDVFAGLARPKDIDLDEQIEKIKDKSDILLSAIRIKEQDLEAARKEQDRYQKQLDKYEKIKLEKDERAKVKKEKAEESRKKALEVARLKTEILKQIEEQQAKDKERLERIAQKAREAEARRLNEKLEKEKMKEKERQKALKAKETAKEKEKLMALKEKDKAKEKLKALKEREKEKEKLRAQRQKEKLKEKAELLKLQLKQKTSKSTRSASYEDETKEEMDS